MRHRSRGFRRDFTLATAVLCLAATLQGQRPSQPAPIPQATFRAGVELVQIDVVVVDERGEHVRGLTSGDFTIADRGKPQQIAAFDEVSHERVDAMARGPMIPIDVRMDVASNSTAQADRLVVMVVDDLHIWRGRTAAAKDIARRVVLDLGDDATMAVLFTSGEKSTQVSNDRSILLAAIDTLEGRQSVRRPNQAVDTQRPGGIDPEASMESALATVQASQDTKLQQFADNMSAFATLKDAARMLGADDARRKAFVFVSEGIAKNPTGIFGTMAEPGHAPAGGAEYASTGDAAATIVAPPVGYHDLALIDMMEAMRRANVTTYAIDPRGEVTSEELAIELHPQPLGGDPIFRWHNPLRQAQDGLTTIAEASGGFAVVNTDDFASGLGRIIGDLDHYYLIGFYPADPKGKGYRPVDVRMPAHPGWTLRFRRGYQAGDPPKPAKETNPLVALSAGVLPATDVSLALSAIPVAEGSGKETRVALALQVSAPSEALVEPDGKLRDELTYEVLVVDEKKKKVKSAGGLAARVTLSPAVDAELLPDTVTYQVADTIQLAPGRYQLRVSARSAKLAKGGSVYLDIDVPDFSKSTLVLGGVALGYAGGPRVATASAVRPRVSPAQRAGRIASPAPGPARPALPFAPTLDRAFAVTDTLRIYFEMAGASAGMLEVLEAGGEQAVVTTRPFTADARGAVEITLPLDTLLEGAYILRATARTATASATREVGFVLR
jgi:VWFA-related protein